MAEEERTQADGRSAASQREAGERSPAVVALDAILLFVENLLAFRVVLGFLGETDASNVVYRLTDVLVAPLNRAFSALVLRADNSTLEIVTVALVFGLVVLHAALDRRMAPGPPAR